MRSTQFHATKILSQEMRRNAEKGRDGNFPRQKFLEGRRRNFLLLFKPLAQQHKWQLQNLYRVENTKQSTKFRQKETISKKKVQILCKIIKQYKTKKWTQYTIYSNTKFTQQQTHKQKNMQNSTFLLAAAITIMLSGTGEASPYVPIAHTNHHTENDPLLGLMALVKQLTRNWFNDNGPTTHDREIKMPGWEAFWSTLINLKPKIRESNGEDIWTLKIHMEQDFDPGTVKIRRRNKQFWVEIDKLKSSEDKSVEGRMGMMKKFVLPPEAQEKKMRSYTDGEYMVIDVPLVTKKPIQQSREMQIEDMSEHE
jgi:hypothetical protein